MKSCKKNKFGLIVMAMLLVVGVLCSLVFANANLVFAKEVFTNFYDVNNLIFLRIATSCKNFK